MMLTLYHDPCSPHSASVRIALAEKRLDYQSRTINLARFEQLGAAFLAVNSAGQVPVLEHDGQRLTETFFILLYLDERFPDPPLGGADPRARYAAQKWGKYVETHFAPNLALLAWALHGEPIDAVARDRIERLTPERRLLWQQANEGFDDADVAAARAAVIKAIERVAEDLGSGAWLAGADYGVADIAVFPHFAHARALGCDMPAPVDRWLERVASRPAVRAAEFEPIGAVVTMGPERGRWG